MHVKQFRNDAIEGGITEYEQFRTSDPEMLLNPAWWQAVGKTRGWRGKSGDENTKFYGSGDLSCEQNPKEVWRWNMLHFIDNLAEGDSYEEALSKLV